MLPSGAGLAALLVTVPAILPPTTRLALIPEVMFVAVTETGVAVLKLGWFL